MWDDLASSLTIHVEPGNTPMPPPAEDALDAFERESGFKLPESYRRFILRFGAGRLGKIFWIASPGYPREQSRASLLAVLDEYRDPGVVENIEEFSDDPERAARLVVFCETITNHFIGWDPEEVTDEDGPEYAIYDVNEEFNLTRVGGSFPAFIEGYCLGDGYLKRYNEEWNQRVMGERRVFEPEPRIRKR